MTRFLGWLLIAVGGLIATLSGLCTLTFVGVTLKDARDDPAASILGYFMLVAIVGGAPFVLGVGMLIAGQIFELSRRTPP